MRISRRLWYKMSKTQRELAEIMLFGKVHRVLTPYIPWTNN